MMYDQNEIHPTAIISCTAIIGKGNIIGPYSIIHGNVKIGNNNKIDSHVSIGSDGEIRDCKDFNGVIKIGDNNIIKESVTIQIGKEGETVVRNNCLLMSKSHIGHDAWIHDNVTISTGAKIGGHCKIHSHTNIGLNAVVHQRKTIESYCMIGMGSTITSDILKFSKVAGNPCRILGFNSMGVDRSDLDYMKSIYEFNESVIDCPKNYLNKFKK